MVGSRREVAAEARISHRPNRESFFGARLNIFDPKESSKERTYMDCGRWSLATRPVKASVIIRVVIVVTCVQGEVHQTSCPNFEV